jgi:hypothetical protein
MVKNQTYIIVQYVVVLRSQLKMKIWNLTIKLFLGFFIVFLLVALFATGDIKIPDFWNMSFGSTGDFDLLDTIYW